MKGHDILLRAIAQVGVVVILGEGEQTHALTKLADLGVSDRLDCPAGWTIPAPHPLLSTS